MNEWVEVMWKTIKLFGRTLRRLKCTKELLLGLLCAVPRQIQAAINERELCVENTETVVVGVNITNQIRKLVAGFSKLLNNKWLVHRWCSVEWPNS